MNLHRRIFGARERTQAQPTEADLRDERALVFSKELAAKASTMAATTSPKPGHVVDMGLSGTMNVMATRIARDGIFYYREIIGGNDERLRVNSLQVPAAARAFYDLATQFSANDGMQLYELRSEIDKIVTQHVKKTPGAQP